MDTDNIRKTLEHYIKLRAKEIDGIRPQLEKIRGYELLIRTMANDLSEQVNLEPLGVDLPSSPAQGAPATTAPNGPRARPNINADEYYGMSQSEAAKQYLRTVGKAIPMDELVGALQAGGAQVGGADPKRTLYVSLKANPKKEFVWPNKDTVGLAEFYQRRK